MDFRFKDYYLVSLNSWSRLLDILELQQSISSLKINNRNNKNNDNKYQMMISCNKSESYKTEKILEKFHKQNNNNIYKKIIN